MSAIAASLLVSVALNVVLAHKVQRLSHAQSARIAERLLKIGTTVPPIAAKRCGGLEEIISYHVAAKPTVLYVFTPPCSWCARNMDNFKALVDKVGGTYHFVGVSVSDEGLAQYVAKNDLKIPVYSGLSPETLKTYKLGSTPQTIVISTEGTVLQDWVGAYVGAQKSQVEAFFHVSLPGLRELPKREAGKN
jgi:peroxiredoxin